MLGEGGADPGPGGGDRRRPAPGGVDAQPKLSGAAGDARGNVQDPVAERFDLAARQVGVIGESDDFGPGDQIRFAAVIECGHLTWPHFGRRSSRILAPAGW